MITVVVDGNYLFHKTFKIFSEFGTKSPGDVLSSETDRNMFLRKVITDLCHALSQIPDINKIVFCKDSKSWRKDYKITRSIYKESRVKSEGVDWGSFFKLMEEFGDFLEENGYIYSRLGGAEGDDLIWAWCDYLRDRGDSVIVISGDKDMHQLVSNSGKNWVGIWNSNSKNNKFIVSEGWEMEKEEEISIFDVDPSSGASDSKLQRFVSSCIIEKIPTKQFVFKKILMGDERDDVPGVFPYLTKTGKPSNIAEGRAQKIWDLYKESPWEKYSLEELWMNDEFLNWLAGLSLRLLGQTDNSENRSKFKQFYEENARLVWLNENSIPDDMVKSLKEHVQFLDTKPRLSSPLTDKKTMIEKSPWAKDTAPPKGFDPFELFN